MYSLNRVTLIGNLGADPETRSMNNGGEVCNFNVACTEKWKNRDGQQQERTEWVRVVVFAEHAVNFAKRYLRKGSKVYVEGKLQTRKWTDQAGQDKYTTEVVIQPYSGEIMGLDRPDGDQRGGYEPGGDFNRKGASREQGSGWGSGNEQSGFGRGGPSPFDSDLDDDVPF